MVAAAANQSWDQMHRQAKVLESRLETKVQKYSSLAQRINADFLCDEENPLIESKEEQSLAAEIDHDLSALADCINGMRNCPPSQAPLHQQEGLVKRFNEIHFDYSTEFKNTSSTVQRKRESMELFHSSKNLHSDDQDFFKENSVRSSIAASMKSINDVISQAFDAKNALTDQRKSLTSSTSGLSGLVANVPSFNRLIDGIQKKKLRESMIVATLVGLLLCFCVWWIFLR